MSFFKRFLLLYLFRIRWRKENKHNQTYPGNIFDKSRVKVGNYTYGQLNVRIFGKTNSKLIIKNFCSIADNTFFLVDGEHNLNTISTYPFKQNILGMFGESISKGHIIIDNDVWIGYNCLILSGVHIGQGAVIAAGSVVTKDVPPYAIVGGVPAKIIKYRFNTQIIKDLLEINYDSLTKEEIEKHINELYIDLKNRDQFEWMIK